MTAALTRFDEAEDADELKQRSIALYERMSAGRSYTFFPTAGVFLEMKYARFQAIAAGVAPDEITDKDSEGVYTIGHESVHIAQLVVSPWLFLHVAGLASIVAETRRLDREGQLGPEAIARLKASMEAELASLREQRDGFSVGEILETQAVVQGLRWAAVRTDATRWRWAVDTFHPGADLYLRLLHLYADELGLGDGLAFELLPRLCALALQTDDPRVAMASLTDRVRNPVNAVAAAGLPTLEFCRWAGVNDPAVLGRSLREREPGLFQRLPWAALLARYFDRFEALPSVGARMDVVFRSDADAPGASIFFPVFTVFADGGIHAMDGNARDYERWTRATLIVVDTMEFLDRA
jgi:hypothetical protein